MRPQGLLIQPGTVATTLLLTLLLVVLSGCEAREESELEPTTGPSQPQFQPLKLATKPSTLPLPPPDWKPATEPFAPGSSTAPSANSAATSRPDDPRATPDSTVRHFLHLCSS